MTSQGIQAASTVVDVRHLDGTSGLLIPADLDVSENLDAYVSGGGYQPLPAPANIREIAAKAALRGAGGAGFPTETKLEAVAAGAGPRIVIANGEEGEPASAKDRWLLRARPHLVLDGLRTAVAAVDANRAVLYLSDEDAAAVVREAVAASADFMDVKVEVVLVSPTYVAGEETAVVRAVEGGEAKPLPKPPRPYEKGVDGSPTLVSNVETLARLALAVRAVDAATATDSVLATVTFDGKSVLLEASTAMTLGELLEQHPDPRAAQPKAVLIGGFAGGIWGPDILSATLSHDDLRAKGSLWGCGAVIAVGQDECVIDVALDVADYFQHASSGQCGSCVRGTQVIVENLTRISRGQPREDDFDKLALRAAAMLGRGNCAMPDADSALITSLLANFGETVQEHLIQGCDVCISAPARSSHSTRFRVKLDALASASFIAQEA